MISFYGEKTYKCEKCGSDSTHPFSKGLCGPCTYKELISHINSLCDTCKNRCKQTSLISIAKCPEYTPKKALDARKGPVAARSTKNGVGTKKKPKEALKRTKRKK